MKLPIPFVLYVLACGLFGLAGWTVYQTLPLLKKETKQDASQRGMNAATDLTAKGRGQENSLLAWRYTVDSAPWWASFKSVNLTGKLPPPPPDQKTGENQAEAPVVVDVRPLADLIELVSLVYDGQAGGRGGDSHVIVRFKTEANAEPAEWYVRENAAPVPGAVQPAPTAPGRDTTPNRPGAQRPTLAAPAARPNQP
ncbi:MAG: hypothetical protein WBO45_16260, partial [Planctomycetota bacterium]